MSVRPSRPPCRAVADAVCLEVRRLWQACRRLTAGGGRSAPTPFAFAGPVESLERGGC